MDTLTEGAELVAESGKTYLAVSPLGQENVWTAVDKDDNSNIVILKSPSTDDTGTSWPQFQHEMVMHELFKESSSIRKQVDRIAPDQRKGSQPVMVLEIFQATLWHARTKRPFTKAEIKSIARAILQGLLEVHAKGLVYVDLKMQNVMLDGFDSDTPSDGEGFITKLGDLGIVMEPASGKAQPVAYRAPEVFFRGVISQAADVWAFGLIYCHLLEAQGRFSKTGMYDDLHNGSGSMFEREQAMRNALANDYDLWNVPYYKDCPLPPSDGSHKAGRHWEALQEHGLDDEDVAFLQWVLKADPRERPSPQTILNSHWMLDDSIPNQKTEGTESKAQAISLPSSLSASTVVKPTPEREMVDAPASEPFDPSGSGAFETLMESHSAIQSPGSPVKDHPLMTEAISKAPESDDATHDLPEPSVPTGNGAASEAVGTGSMVLNAATTSSDPNDAKFTQSTTTEQSAVSSAAPKTGGTYLSYR